MLEGWKCPRCKKINAPFTNQCTCSEQEVASNQSVCDHFWIYIGTSSDNTLHLYKCSKCDMYKSVPAGYTIN